MQERHIYQLFNIRVDSQFKIDLLEELDDPTSPIDAYIVINKVPSLKEDIIYEDAFSKLTQHEYLLKVDEVANFYIANGNYICIEPIEALDVGNISLFLLGSILGVLLAQREAVIVHSSSNVIDNKAILFCGQSGAGKSTLATAFRLNGYPLLSDDINLLKVNPDQEVIAYKGFPQQKLSKEAIQQLDINANDYTLVPHAKGKYITKHITCFEAPFIPIKAIYELEPADVSRVQIIELTGKEKLIGMMKNLFRLQVRYYTGTSTTFMKELTQIAGHIHYFKVKRPKSKFCVTEVMESILANCKN